MAYAGYGYGGWIPPPPGIQAGYVRLGNASAVMSDAMTDPHSIQLVAAHELGHTFALDECSYCSVTDSVMVLGKTYLNDPTTGPQGPTYCDNQQVLATDIDAEIYGSIRKKSSYELAHAKPRHRTKILLQPKPTRGPN